MGCTEERGGAEDGVFAKSALGDPAGVKEVSLMELLLSRSRRLPHSGNSAELTAAGISLMAARIRVRILGQQVVGGVAEMAILGAQEGQADLLLTHAAC